MAVSIDVWEFAARMFEPVKPKWPTPGAMAKALDPKTVQTPALDLIDQKLVDLRNTPDGRFALAMSPQEGKVRGSVAAFRCGA